MSKIDYNELVEFVRTHDEYYVAEIMFGNRQRISELEQELAELKEKAIVVPVKLSDTIYVIPSEINYRSNIVNRREDRNKVYKYLVDEIRYNKYGFSIVSYIDSVPFYFNEKIPKNLCVNFDTEKFYGETWFTTEQEAQAKLKEIKGNE